MATLTRNSAGGSATTVACVQRTHTHGKSRGGKMRKSRAVAEQPGSQSGRDVTASSDLPLKVENEAKSPTSLCHLQPDGYQPIGPSFPLSSSLSPSPSLSLSLSLSLSVSPFLSSLFLLVILNCPTVFAIYPSNMLATKCLLHARYAKMCIRSDLSFSFSLSVSHHLSPSLSLLWRSSFF